MYFVGRSIGTSSKDSQSTISLDGAPKTQVRKTRKSTSWKSYGFDFIDQREDIFKMHLSAFSLVTLLLWGSAFFFAFAPNPEDINKDWVHREAMIQLRRREVLGLPLVSKDYVDPSTIVLPPDEELGDDDIII